MSTYPACGEIFLIPGVLERFVQQDRMDDTDDQHILQPTKTDRPKMVRLAHPKILADRMNSERVVYDEPVLT